MKRPETPFGGQDSAEQRGLYLAMELSHRQWQLGLTDRRHKMLRVTVEARNFAALQEQIRLAKAHILTCGRRHRCSAATKPVVTVSGCIATW